MKPGKIENEINMNSKRESVNYRSDFLLNSFFSVSMPSVHSTASCNQRLLHVFQFSIKHHSAFSSLSTIIITYNADDAEKYA